MRKSGLLVALLAAVIAGCGGGSEDDAFQPGIPPDAPNTPVVASVTVLTDAPTVPSDGATPANISVFVKDANNRFVQAIPVTFSATSGGLLVSSAVTDVNGLAKATLSSAGDPTPRAITVTATAGGISSTVRVSVTGTVLTVQGPAALTSNQVGTYTVTLVDAGNDAIANRAVTVASARSNTLSATSVTTDFTGHATFTMTAVSGGNDTLTVTTLGISATQGVAVNTDTFAFTAPAAGTEIPLAATQTVTARWLIGGVPQVGQPITFSTTRGTVTPTTANTDGTGSATATVSSLNAGGAVVSAASAASSAQLSLEYVATTPANIDAQPSAFSIGTSQTSTITAVVRDVAGNLVKNKTVVFTLDDITGGTLSVGTSITDSQGRAQTIYTSSTTTSANEGVKITSTVQGTVIAKTVALTVARREVFISIGTGNEIFEPNSAQYRVEYAVQLTDSNGNGVPNVPMSIRVLSQRYFKGKRVTAVAPATGWDTQYSVLAPAHTRSSLNLLTDGCADEDVNRNGILDPGEDFNTSTRLEAGNIVTVTPSNSTTDANGFALVNLYYPQEYAYYLTVTLSANATVQGTEYVRSSFFMLEGSSIDFASTASGAPGPISPFGLANTCSNKD
jgi:hypothetical protein